MKPQYYENDYKIHLKFQETSPTFAKGLEALRSVEIILFFGLLIRANFDVKKK